MRDRRTQVLAPRGSFLSKSARISTDIHAIKIIILLLESPKLGRYNDINFIKIGLVITKL